MKTNKDLPAFLRYFKARSTPFTKPLFLGSVGGLLVAGLAIYQYWRHPEWLQTSSESVVNTDIIEQQKSANTSSEDLAAAANLDNIDLLLKELEQNETLNAFSTEEKTKFPELKKEESEFSRFQKKQKEKFLSGGKSNSAVDSDPYYLGTGSGNQKIIELLQPPSFTSYQSSINIPQTTIPIPSPSTPQENIIPNPVGNIYLSNRTNPQLSPPPPTSSLNPGETTNVSEPTPTNSNNGEVTSAPNGQNPQLNNSQQTASNLSNKFVPASSAIQSQSTLSAPITSSAIPSSSASANPINSYTGTNSNAVNSYAVNGQRSSFVDGRGNLANPTNSGANNVLGTNSQFNQNSNVSGLGNRPNQIGGGNLTTTETINSPSALQNNYRSARSVNTNFNRSAPRGYQLQPQGYSLNGFGQNDNLSNRANPNAPSNSNGLENTNSSLFTPSLNNLPLTTPSVSPSLQPSGTLSTSEIGR